MSTTANPLAEIFTEELLETYPAEKIMKALRKLRPILIDQRVVHSSGNSFSLVEELKGDENAPKLARKVALCFTKLAETLGGDETHMVVALMNGMKPSFALYVPKRW